MNGKELRCFSKNCRNGFHAQRVQLEDGSEQRVSIGNQLRAWEVCGGAYLQIPGRRQDALAVFRGLSGTYLRQASYGVGIHKAMPLVYIADCHLALNHTVLAKRYMMLTAVEDAILRQGQVPPNEGVYFRLVWHFGMPRSELLRLSTEAARIGLSHPVNGRYPEWVLQELDQNWMIEFPTPEEASRYEVTAQYVQSLIDGLGDGTGQTLERLAHYLLGAIPGCRALRRQQSNSTDYDVVCALEGFDLDFRSDLGRYFVCECKDWNTAADFTAFAKFCRVLDSVKCKFGIISSPSDISGKGKRSDAELEQMKVYQDRGIVIVVINNDDLKSIVGGANLIAMLRRKYEETRLDLHVTGVLTPMPETGKAAARRPRPGARGRSQRRKRPMQA